MYSHKLVEDLEYTKKIILSNAKKSGFLPEQVLPDFYKLLDSIKNSEKYHFGLIENIENISTNQTKYFCEEYGVNIRLPFKNCWFDYYDKNNQKFGFSLAELTSGCMMVDFYIEEATGNQKIFVPNPYRVFIGIENDVENSVMAEINRAGYLQNSLAYREVNPNLVLTWGDSNFDKNKMLNPFLFKEPTEPKEFLDEILSNLKRLNACLMLLNCKNVQTKTIPASAKLNKKRKKIGKPQISDHHIILVNLSGVIQKREGGYTKTGQPVSIRAGHFKTYTKEKPLFGRMVGRYWWQPIAKGDPRENVVKVKK